MSASSRDRPYPALRTVHVLRKLYAANRPVAGAETTSVTFSLRLPLVVISTRSGDTEARENFLDAGVTVNDGVRRCDALVNTALLSSTVLPLRLILAGRETEAVCATGAAVTTSVAAAGEVPTALLAVTEKR